MNYVGTLIKNKNKKMYLIDCFKPERCTIFWCVTLMFLYVYSDVCALS